ncbi:MAG: cobalamin biosynthesis protein CbiA [Desulfobacterales bacterium]|nr:cobalamin biosynthesis protein CbiA [Desulfobacterales bacterium]
MKIDLKGLVILAGNYGSGKTEVCINLAVYAMDSGQKVRVADLDLVNPYFRTREARKALTDLGIELVLPPEKYLNADLPVLSPVIAGMIRSSGDLTLLDVGGDAVGARVLACLFDALQGREARMLQVVNPYRPYTDSVQGCMRMRAEIEKASRMRFAGIVGNANMIDETSTDHIYEGYAFVEELSRKTGLELIFITAPADLLPGIDLARFSCPVLPIQRQLVPPWKRPEIFRSDSK